MLVSFIFIFILYVIPTCVNFISLGYLFGEENNDKPEREADLMIIHFSSIIPAVNIVLMLFLAPLFFKKVRYERIRRKSKNEKK